MKLQLLIASSAGLNSFEGPKPFSAFSTQPHDLGKCNFRILGYPADVEWNIEISKYPLQKSA